MHSKPPTNPTFLLQIRHRLCILTPPAQFSFLFNRIHDLFIIHNILYQFKIDVKNGEKVNKKTCHSLSKEQQDAYDLYLSGQNILVSGPGGSGKSILIKKINEHARQTNKRIQICALTGVATSNLNISKAKTLNSWSGIGLAKEDHNVIIEKVATNRYKKKYWSTRIFW